MKKLQLISVGARPPAWADAAANFYARQLRRFQLVETRLKPSRPPQESEAILRRAGDAAPLILLDVAGRPMDSAAFASALERWLHAPAPALVLAGADGAAPQLRARADETLSLSALTFPHHLARVVLIEQLFRADCALHGHPYPR